MKAKKVFCVLMAIIFCITLLPNTVLATSDNARYLMDAETLPDGTIAVLFIKGGTASSGTISGGALYYGVYDPSNDEWTEEPVGETAPTAKEAALALDGSTAHVAYVNSDDEIAYTYQRRSGWADEEIIESNNCNEKVGVLSSVDICVDNEGNAYISYIDTQGAEDDSYRKPDGMYATNASGKFVKTVIANCTGYGDSWGRWYDEMVAPIKIAAGDEKVQVSFDIHTYDWTNGSGAWNGYAFHFTANGTSLDTNSSGRVVDVCSDGTDFYTLLSQSGKYFVVNDNVKIEETELTTTVTAADITIDDSEIYYATISGTTLNFYQDGTFVEDVTADTAILSGYNRFTTVICDGEQYVIYTGSDEDNSLVISKLDGDEMVEFLVPNPPSTYSVTITIADNMTKTSGEDEQDVIVEEDMTDVVYEANEGYCFPETYEVDGENGVTVTRNSATQITVSGTPTDDVEIVLIAPSAHTEADPVTENTVDATCTEDGSYDEVVYCSNCGVELSRTQEIIPASHTEADPVEENTIDPTCTEAGSYDEVIYCSVCGEELSRTPNEIPATGHTEADAVTENEVPVTCEEDGSYDEVIYCSVCGEEISRTPNEIPATGHTEADPVTENEVPVTCEEDGSYDEVIYCSTCGEELSRTPHVVPALTHDWSEPTYDWAADNSSVTATRVCGNDETHIQTEQVNTISEVTLDPTVEAPGETTYTATFEAEYFEEQTLTIANIPALILIEEVAFNNVTLPIHGDEYFEPALDDGEHYTVSYASWTDEKYGTPDTFEADHTYYLTIGLVPESGYVFADELNVYINDDEPVSVRTEDVLDGTEIKIAIDVPNNTHTVTFDEGEEVLQPYSTLTGANGKLDEIPNPTKQRSGYNFKGWYTEATDGTKITTDTIFTEDTTVFAQWTRKTSSGGGGSSSPTTYKVTVATIENGKVTSSATSASKGTTITLTVTPNENYELDKIEVTTKNGEKVTLAGENNKYTFSMPNSDVTVNATFATEEYIIIDEDGENEENEGNKENETTSGLQFSDVHEEDYFFGAVNWAIDHNITSGTSKTTFSPDNSATRAQTVTFIWNAAGKPTPTTTNNPFTDVNENDYYYKAVLWAYENGVTAGTSETTFSPDNIVTRAQAVTFLYNLSNANSEGENPFTDVTEEDYFFNSVIWAYTNNITHGTTKTTFSPNNDCTRAQIVTFLYNYYSNL